MKLQAKINGQPCVIQIDGFPVERLAYTTKEAAQALGVCSATVQKLINTGKLTRTMYGVIPLTSLQSHLAAEMKK